MVIWHTESYECVILHWHTHMVYILITFQTIIFLELQILTINLIVNY